MTHDEIIQVVQGCKAGRKIQSKRKGSNEAWQRNTAPAFNFADFDYRLEPEPVEVWANFYPGGGVATHPSQQEAKDACDASGRTILLREVINQ